MGVWNKSPQADPNAIVQLQATLDADPRMHTIPAGGWIKNPQWKSQTAKQILGPSLPDGYDVDINGNIVYTNKTPILKQLTETAGPVAGMMIAGPFLPGQAGYVGNAVNGVADATTAAATHAAAAGTGAAAGVAGVENAINHGGAAGAGSSLLSGLLSPKGATGLAALIPALLRLKTAGSGSSGGPFGANTQGIYDDLQKGLESQQARYDAAGPAFQTAQNMALGMAPVRYRSGAGPF